MAEDYDFTYEQKTMDLKFINGRLHQKVLIKRYGVFEKTKLEGRELIIPMMDIGIVSVDFEWRAVESE